MANDDLQEELRDKQDSMDHFQEMVDSLREQLDLPPLYKKKTPPPIFDDAP